MDYTSTGTLSGMNTVCVAMNTKCPCGKNTLTCSDPNDAEDNLCEPKYAGSVLNKCPKPCTPDDEAQGNKTCVQTHLSSTGDFLSETISCTKECPPGRNMKKCASGAVVPAWKQCQDFYKQSGNATEVVSAGEKQTSKVILTLDSVSSTALSNSENVRVMVNAELYLPQSISSSITVKQSGTARRLTQHMGRMGRYLAAARRMNTGGAVESPARARA